MASTPGWVVSSDATTRFGPCLTVTLRPARQTGTFRVGLVEAEGLRIELPPLLRQPVFLLLLARIEEAHLGLEPVELRRRDLVDAGEVAQVGNRGHQAAAGGALPVFLGMADRAHAVGLIGQHMRFQVWAIAFFHDDVRPLHLS